MLVRLELVDVVGHLTLAGRAADQRYELAALVD
jgi:hypothetical protein